MPDILEPDDDDEDTDDSDAIIRALTPMRPRMPRSPGHYSNAAITRRNGGVRHQFLDSIGGCSANYR